MKKSREPIRIFIVPIMMCSWIVVGILLPLVQSARLESCIAEASLPSQASAESAELGRSSMTKPGTQTWARVADTYGSRLPMTFEINRGQLDSQVKFVARTGAQTIFLTSTEAVIALCSTERRVPQMPVVNS